MQDLLHSLREGHELSPDQIHRAAAALLAEERAVADKVAFLRALQEKGETPSEIAGFVSAFLGHARKPSLLAGQAPGPMIDVCGTGGDKLDLFNVSTTSMFVLAGAGLAVVKHGNRGITSKSGGADVLEALGVAIDLGPEDFTECVKRTGLGFLFAPHYHPAFKTVVPARKLLAEQGQKSIFNLLGPLLNPVQPPFQLIGVFDQALPPIYAEILRQLGRTRAWAVHGKTADGRGMDEMSTLGPTHVSETAASVRSWWVERESLSLARADLADLQGGEAKENAAILEGILGGDDRGPKRDIVCLNAAAALVLAGLAADLAEGLALAQEAIDRGAALAKMRALREFRAAA